MINTALPSPIESPSGRASSRDERFPFDGVICFGGEDWWYHNRGHYDMQMMRELSAPGGVPVMYINSIGMRLPRMGEGRMFLTRIERKLRSINRGMVTVRPNFTVVSPTVIPGRWGMQISRMLLLHQVREGARSLGMSRALLWVACPPAAEIAQHVGAVAMVYQRTDRYEKFRHVDPELVARWDRQMKATAGMTLFCSSALYHEERWQCRAAVLVDHGVDYEHFARAGEYVNEPADVQEIARPRAGFIGGIDAHTFDPGLFVAVAQRMPDVQFVMVGACSLPEGWCRERNVHLLGQRPYEQVADYMASCEVLIMPWNQSKWIAACNPVKLQEYLAVGRPVVTTWFDELSRYEGYVTVARNAEEFAAAIARGLQRPDDPKRLRARVERETWSSKAASIVERLGALCPEMRAA